MPRPRKPRCIRQLPEATLYKPRGVALHCLQGVTLPLEGMEALRLVDAEGISREAAARLMEISPPTLCRILAEARRLIARALANGWAIRIEGGDYTLIDSDSSLTRKKECRRRPKRCCNGRRHQRSK